MSYCVGTTLPNWPSRTSSKTCTVGTQSAARCSSVGSQNTMKKEPTMGIET
jgi:hypothetical protein